MNSYKHLFSFKSLLCLNGTLPGKYFFEKYQNLPIIAADGAANTLIENNIIPNCVIGDLDSFSDNYREKYKNKIQKVIHTPDQNYTDFEKTIFEMRKDNLFPALVLGATGGEMDHVFYNFQCLLKYGKENPMVFYESHPNNIEKWGVPIYKDCMFKTKPKQIISLIPYPNACVSTTGLKWELNKTVLSNEQSSVRNQAIDTTVSIQIFSGKILVISTKINPYAAYAEIKSHPE